MKKTLLGTFEDGSPHYLYEADGDEIVLLTGPVVAVLEMSDGTSYDVTDHAIVVDPQHHDELVNAIAQRYVDEGHPIVGEFKHDAELTSEVLADANVNGV